MIYDSGENDAIVVAIARGSTYIEPDIVYKVFFNKVSGL